MVNRTYMYMYVCRRRGIKRVSNALNNRTHYQNYSIIEAITITPHPLRIMKRLLQLEALRATPLRPALDLRLRLHAILLRLLDHLVLQLLHLLHRQALRLGLLLSGLETGAVGAVAVVGVERAVPPAEGGGEVVDEGHVVEVVVLGAGPEGEDVLQGPGEV